MKLITILFYLISIPSAAQVINGRITDPANKEGLPGALVLNLVDSTMAVSDENGNFAIEIEKFPASLSVSSIGYKLREVRVEEYPGLMNIALKAQSRHLNEVVVSATRFNEKIIDVPAAVHSINEVELMRNDETIIMPVINRMPGILMESGSLNTNRLSIRGIGSRTPYGTNRVRAYYNDIPLTTGEGESTLEDIDLGTLERVEIIKGPASGIYGAGLGGTVNLIGAVPDYNTSSIRTQVTKGSFGLLNTRISLNLGMKNGGLYVGVNDLYSSGFRENSKYLRKSATVSSIIYGDNDFTLSFLGSFIKLKSFIPSSIGLTAFFEEPSSAPVNWKESRGYEAYIKSFAGFSAEYRISDELKTYSSVFFSFRDADEPRPFDILRENTVATGFRTRFEYQSLLNQRPLTLQAGGEVFADWYQWSLYENLYEDYPPGHGSVSGSIFSDNKERRDYYNLFGQFRWETSDRLAIEGGLNYNNTSYELTDLFYDDIDQSGNYSFKPVLSPRIGLVYTIKDTWNAFFTSSHGFSMPSLAETLTPEGLINTDIKPETGTNLEIGTKGHWFREKLSGEISVYRMYINNLLVAERSGPDQYVGINAGKTIHDGIEMLLNYQFDFSNDWSAQPFLSITATNYRFEEYIHRETNYAGKSISGFPDKIFNLGIDIMSEKGFYLYGDYRYVGEAPLNDGNTLYNSSYSLINFKTGYIFELRGGWELDVKGGINNLTDEKYASMVLVNAVAFGNNEPRYYYPGLPRNLYGGISLKYNF